jgi:signal transduction histidine kinase
MEEKEVQMQAEIDQLKKTISGMELTSKMLVRRDIDLRRAYDNLKSLDREKTEFVSIAAHQLRTPVTTARWAMKSLETSLSATLDTDQSELLERAANSVDRIFNLTEDLLELNRIDFGDTSIHPVSSSVEKLLESTIEDHRPQIEKRLLTVEKVYAANSKAVCFDPAKIRDAVDNIFDNAIKYTPVGGEIKVTTTYNPDNQLQIKIYDTGIGVGKGLEEKIFQKFTRLGNAEAVDPNGIGLGLYVARSFVEKHKGTLVYTHNQPHGSIFTLTIPS